MPLRLLPCLLVCLASWAGAGATAEAATVVRVESELEYPQRGAPFPVLHGEVEGDDGAENVTVTVGGGRLQVRSLTGVTARDGCRLEAATLATCSLPVDVRVALAGGDDDLSATGLPVKADGGEGADRLEGDGVLSGSAGVDVLQAGPGGARMVGGAGPDEMRGGPGLDAADFSDHTTVVTADLDGIADDGAAGEGDRVSADVEDLTGGTSVDHLTGDDRDNALSTHSLSGQDELPGELVDGGGGDDKLYGSQGDVLLAGDGDDLVVATGGFFRGMTPTRVVGGAGNDLLVGSLGVDHIDAGPGVDSVQTTGGEDKVLLRDGTRDGVSCRDDSRVEIDANDIVRHCRRIDRVGAARALVNAAPGAGVVTVFCPSDSRRRCRGRLRVRGRGRTLVDTRVVLAPGHLTQRRLPAARGTRHVNAEVRLDYTDDAGRTRSTVQQVRFTTYG